MTQEEIIEGNELIAIFNEDIDNFYKWDGCRFTNGINWIIPEYHSSWDWLMPVCIKCSEIAKEYEDYSIEASTYNNIKFHLLTFNLENIWRKVVEFIKCYNQNKKL